MGGLLESLVIRKTPFRIAFFDIVRVLRAPEVIAEEAIERVVEFHEIGEEDVRVGGSEKLRRGVEARKREQQRDG